MEQSKRKTGSLITTLLLLLAAAAGWFFRYDIYDWWRLRGYDPPAGIAKLAEQTTMTSEGKKYFYVSRPELIEKNQLRGNCNINEFSIILGCYIPPTKIYVIDVNDPRLAGIEQVTAAHEMLHAAYQRLDGSQKDSLNQQLNEAFEQVDDQRIKDTIKQYRLNDANSVGNELHSILATEVRSLPTELENYYKKYFDDRLKVVSYSERYENEFSSRKRQVAQYDLQIESLKAEIEQNKQFLQSERDNLEAERQSIENDNDGTGDQAALQARIDAFRADVQEFNAVVRETENKVAQHNELVKKRNALAIEVQDLVQAIDSTPSSL